MRARIYRSRSPPYSRASPVRLFKLADGWSRDLVLGLKGEPGREVITDADRKVREAYRPDVDIETLAHVLKMSSQSVFESIEKLKRNELVGGTNK